MAFTVKGVGFKGSISLKVAPVHNITQDTYYDSIAWAVYYANPSDVIEVRAGTYTETVYIDKALTLRGPNYNKAGNDPTRVPEATIVMPESAANQSAMLYGAADNITVEGFNLEFPDSRISAGKNIGNLWYSSPLSNLTIRNNRMYSSEIPIYIYWPDANKTGLLIEGNYIDCGPYVNSGFGRGIYVRGPAGIIQDNVIVNSSIGIQVSNWNVSGTVTVRRNLVQAATAALYNNAQTRGSGAVLWQQNEVTLAPNDRLGLKAQVSGPYTGLVNFSAIQYRYMNAGSGAFPTATFNNNTIDLTKTPGVTYNSTVLRSVWMRNDVPAGVTATGSNNSITGWTVAALNEGSVAANYANNWWGTTDTTAISAAISNTGGGSFNITPILTSGTDSQPGTIGFQP